ncbi:MAG TPA: tyrosine recombinase [Acidimicrobiales bacterium]|nr:tyrosine recombinase [Acidimicrobiales bacterium]
MGPGRALPSGAALAALSLEAEELLSWLSVERGRSQNTIISYRRDLLAYETWLRQQAANDHAQHAGERAGGPDGAAPGAAGDVDEATVSRYVGHLRAKGLAPASVARAVVAVRSFHRFMALEGRAIQDPARDLKPPRLPQSLPKALTESEVKALLAAVTGTGPLALRDRAVLEVLYATGARISELTAMSLADLAIEEQLVRVTGKGNKERLVPLGRYARQALVEWLGPGGRPLVMPKRWARRSDSDAVFLNARGGRISRQGVWGIVKHYGDRAGLAGRLSPHVLRHSCATHLLDHGADIRIVQEVLGHASVATTQVYTKVSAQRLKAAYLSAHPRARQD